MDMEAVLIGTSGSVPTARRGLPALMLRHGSSRVLFDCGEGTQRQLAKSEGLVDLDAIFITHFHADHWLGLPGILKTFDLRERSRPLQVYGPQGLDRIFGLIEAAVGRTRFEVNPVELGEHEPVRFDGLSITPFGVNHRGAALGYVAHEPPRPGRVDLDRAAALGIEPGPELGQLQRGESVRGIEPSQVVGPERPGRKLVISGDTAPCEQLTIAAHGCDVLVHEATFLHEEADRAAEKAHSTARQAAELAASSGAKLLVLTHVSSRYSGKEIEEEARLAFDHSHVARDFDRVVIPVEEKGVPVLERRKHRNQREHSNPVAEEPGTVT